jgi:hypothetical protein
LNLVLNFVPDLFLYFSPYFKKCFRK